MACPSGKLRHKTRRAAERRATWLALRGHEDKPASARVYRCAMCKGFHVTSQKKVGG